MASKKAAAATSKAAAAKDDPAGCVYRAVLRGVSADELRRVIDEYAERGGGSRAARDARRRDALDWAAPVKKGWGYSRGDEDEDEDDEEEDDELGGGRGGGAEEDDGEYHSEMGHSADAWGGLDCLRPNCSLRQTALRVAHYEKRRGDLVAVMIEAGADIAISIGPACNPLAFAFHYDNVDLLRSLLRSGRCRVSDKMPYPGKSSVRGCRAEFRADSCWSLPVHLAIRPPKENDHAEDEQPLPRLRLLKAMVREFGADVNAPDGNGLRPLHWACAGEEEWDIWTDYGGDDEGPPVADREASVRQLVAMGADLGARDFKGRTALHMAVFHGDGALVPVLLELGASADVFDARGLSPLMAACGCSHAIGRVPRLVDASSTATRRAVESRNGWSALDFLYHIKGEGRRAERKLDCIFRHVDDARAAGAGPELDAAVSAILAAGAPFKPENAPPAALLRGGGGGKR